jgi:hypothetical protein
MMGVPQGTPLDIFTQATAGEVIDSESWNSASLSHLIDYVDGQSYDFPHQSDFP